MATLQQVLDTIDVEPLGNDSFSAKNIYIPTENVYGGQFLAQSIIAAAKTTSEFRLPNSVHAYFIKGGVLAEDLEYKVDRLRDGVKFSHREGSAFQKSAGNSAIFKAMINFHEEEGSAIDFSGDVFPNVPQPQDLKTMDEVFSEITTKNKWVNYFSSEMPLEIRQISPSLFLENDTTAEKVEAAWVRVRPEDADLVKTPLQQIALLAFISDQFAFSPALRKGGVSWLTKGASYVSLDHTQYFHRAIDLTKWHLFYGTSPAGANARGVGISKVFNQDKEVVSTVIQEGSIRTADSTHKTGRVKF